jgi:hypothetical protein
MIWKERSQQSARTAPTTVKKFNHVPTALFGASFPDHGSRHSLAVRDNHMRAQLIDFGCKRPSFKRVKVDELIV